MWGVGGLVANDKTDSHLANIFQGSGKSDVGVKNLKNISKGVQGF